MKENKIILEEQGLRDGIQNLDITLSTDKKLEYIEQLLDAGIKRIQIASFVHPRLVPQMADAEELISRIKKRPDVSYTGLVLNVKGVERAMDTQLDHLACSISVSDTHSQKNTRMNLTQAREKFTEMVKLAKSNDMKVRAGLQCVFGCRYEGNIAKDQVLQMVDQHLQQDIDELALADSTGMANPKYLQELMSEVVEKAHGIPVILHLHNTESKGLANVYAALQAGVKIFDTAFGGLGGCPFIKNATGNIATEDTAHMLQQMGYHTGIDIKKVATVSKDMEKTLGKKLQGRLYELIDNYTI